MPAPAPTVYYPPPAFAFSVAIVPGPTSSGTPTAIDAAFNEVSGLDPHVEIEEVIEGGVNGYVHQLPGVTKHSNLVLKRGYVTQASTLAQWAAQTVGSTLAQAIQPQALMVSLLGPNAQPAASWTFQNAWPVKWDVSGFSATRNDFLTETLEIAYSTVTRTSAPTPPPA